MAVDQTDFEITPGECSVVWEQRRAVVLLEYENQGEGIQHIEQVGVSTSWSEAEAEVTDPDVSVEPGDSAWLPLFRFQAPNSRIGDSMVDVNVVVDDDMEETEAAEFTERIAVPSDTPIYNALIAKVDRSDVGRKVDEEISNWGFMTSFSGTFDAAFFIVTASDEAPDERLEDKLGDAEAEDVPVVLVHHSDVDLEISRDPHTVVFSDVDELREEFETLMPAIRCTIRRNRRKEFLRRLLTELGKMGLPVVIEESLRGANDDGDDPSPKTPEYTLLGPARSRDPQKFEITVLDGGHKVFVDAALQLGKVERGAVFMNSGPNKDKVFCDPEVFEYVLSSYSEELPMRTATQLEIYRRDETDPENRTKSDYDLVYQEWEAERLHVSVPDSAEYSYIVSAMLYEGGGKYPTPDTHRGNFAKFCKQGVLTRTSWDTSVEDWLIKAWGLSHQTGTNVLRLYLPVPWSFKYEAYHGIWNEPDGP